MRLVAFVLALLAVSGVIVFTLATADSNIDARSVSITPYEENLDQFARVYGPEPLSFPEDLGPHPAYQTEWWYYTGNLADEAGNRYGFQLTFFRRALTAEPADRESEWGSGQVYFAHFTVSDIANRAFYPAERFSRGGANLAGAQAEPYHVWLEGWEAREVGPNQVRLYATTTEGVSIDLILESQKPVVLQGDQGYSPKSNDPGNASFYYSLTRNQVTGTVTTPDATVAVNGLAWKDHEWSTSALGQGAIGWDWFSLQMDDQREIMFFHIRKDDGSIEPASKGSLVAADGESRRLSKDEVELTVLDTWRSPASGAEYPVKWRFVIPGEDIDLTITALMPNQELNVSTRYWEGAVRFEGTQTGYGYVEMTGYAESMENRF